VDAAELAVRFSERFRSANRSPETALFTPLWIGQSRSWSLRIPVLDPGGQAVKSEPVPSEFHEYTRRVSAALQQASLVVAPTRAMLDSIDLYYDSPVPKKVVPNGRSPIALLFRSKGKYHFFLPAGSCGTKGRRPYRLPFEQLPTELSWPVYAAWRVPSVFRTDSKRSRIFWP